MYSCLSVALLRQKDLKRMAKTKKKKRGEERRARDLMGTGVLNEMEQTETV